MIRIISLSCLLSLYAACVHAAAPSVPTQQAPTTGTRRLVPPITFGACNQWKLQTSGDLRCRFESRHNYDFNSDIPDNDDLSFLRTRWAFELSHSDDFRAFLEFFDARVYNENVDLMQEDHFDVHQAFLEYTAKCPGGQGTVYRLGRQEVALGEMRLIGNPAWVNLIPKFDGVRVIHKTVTTELNFLLLQNVFHQTIHNGVVTTDRGRSKNREWLYGLYSTLKPRPGHEADLYFLGLSDLDDDRDFPVAVVGEDGRSGTTDRYTVGTRLRGPLCEFPECGVLGYGFEAAYQFGHRAHDDINARMVHGDVNYQFTTPWKPRLAVETNLASGDKRFGDGRSNTFVPLFQAAHDPYGIIDFVRLQNLREIALTGSVEPSKKLKLQAGLHHLWLDSPTDAWYSASGGAIARDRTGKSGRKIGKEIDFVATYKCNENLSFQAGTAHFLTRKFADATGRKDNSHLFYLQTVLKF